MELDRISLDFSIWSYMSNGERKKGGAYLSPFLVSRARKTCPVSGPPVVRAFQRVSFLVILCTLSLYSGGIAKAQRRPVLPQIDLPYRPSYSLYWESNFLAARDVPRHRYTMSVRKSAYPSTLLGPLVNLSGQIIRSNRMQAGSICEHGAAAPLLYRLSKRESAKNDKKTDPLNALTTVALNWAGLPRSGSEERRQ